MKKGALSDFVGGIVAWQLLTTSCMQFRVYDILSVQGS